MNKNVRVLSVILLLACSLQAVAGWQRPTVAQPVSETILNGKHYVNVRSAGVQQFIAQPTSKLGWVKNGLHKLGQTRFFKTIVTQGTKVFRSAKAHPIIAIVATTALIGTIAYIALTHKKTTQKKAS